jgi:hypothetical protein
LLCLQMHTFCGLHLFSQCIRSSFDSPRLFHLNISAEDFLLGFKEYVGGLANVHGLLTLPGLCVCASIRTRVCVRMCAYSVDSLSFCSWDHGSAHTLCADRTRRERAVRWNLQRTHFRWGASGKLMGIVGSTFRTSQVWHQKAYYSHKFVFLVWIWCLCTSMA